MNTLPIEPKEPTSDKQHVRVRRGRVESVDLYEIKENELELLEKGAPSGLFLNFSVFLLSLAFSTIISLSTATFVNSSIHTLFVVVSVVGVLGGGFLLILWWRTRESITQVISHIRGRIPPDVAGDETVRSSSDIAPKG
ncbi:MAG: hypothetical protein H8D23_09970 [Candidatus Brocadiales bacterium]|nr:hypothetical protein [Candidatus Brocadiales bacterium]